MANIQDPFEQVALQRLLLFIYLVPVFGMVPAVWTLLWRRGETLSARKHRETSRMAIAVGLLWLLGVVTLSLGGATGGDAMQPQLSFLFMNSLLTSGYFVTLLVLMVQVWQRRPVALPGFRRFTKYLP